MGESRLGDEAGGFAEDAFGFRLQDLEPHTFILASCRFGPIRTGEYGTSQCAVQGLIAAEHSLEKTAERIARAPSWSGDGGDTVSLSEEAVGLLSARNAYEMNLQVLKANAMAKKLVDFMA